MHTVYIKPELSTIISNQRVTIGDICQVYCYEETLAKEVRNLELFHIDKQEKRKISVSSLYLVRYISDRKPGILVINLGESDFIIEYKPPEQEKKWLEVLKEAAKAASISSNSSWNFLFISSTHILGW